MRSLAIIVVCLLLNPSVMANEEVPSLEMLLFLAEFTDEQGNWEGPDIEQASPDQEMNEGEQYD